MWKTKSCSRCGGDIFIDKDMDGWYGLCIQCGDRTELKPVVIDKKLFVEKKHLVATEK
jgi:hypothetical protein